MLQHEPQELRTRQAPDLTLLTSTILIGKTYMVVVSAQNILLADDAAIEVSTHLMGSHFKYEERYPPEASYFHGAQGEQAQLDTLR